MQEHEALIENPRHHALGFCQFVCVVALQQRFGQLDIPIANLAPNKGIERVGSVVEPVGGEGCIHLFTDFGSLTNDPFVDGLLWD